MAWECGSFRTVAVTRGNIVMEIATGEDYAMVVSKDNPALTEAINKALADMQEDGTMDEIAKELTK